MLRIFFGWSLFVFSIFAAAADELPPVTFGIVPQQSASELAERWTPVMTYLSKVTGRTFKFSTARDIPTFERRLAAGEYDFAYMNPYHYTVFHERPGYTVFARENTKLVGIIVVRKDGPIHSLSELRRQTLAFPGPASFAATLLPLAHFRLSHIPVRAAYVSSHDSVYLSVTKGLYAAGGGVVHTFDALDAHLRDRLRILWRTPAYVPHALAAHPRVDARLVAQVRHALMDLDRSDTGRAMLRRLDWASVIAASDADYDAVRALHIGSLTDLLHKD